jgi:hypothetical protein
MPNVKVLATLVDKLLRKDIIPSSKTFVSGRIIEDHLKNVNNYLKATGINDKNGHLAILLNSLDGDIQVTLFSQPGFENNADNYGWLCDKLLELFKKKCLPISLWLVC